MESPFENMVYTAVGTAAIATNKVKELLEDLMQNNDYTRDEGRRIVKALKHDMEEMKIKVDNKVYVLVDDILVGLRLPTQEKWKEKVEGIRSGIANNPVRKAMRRNRSLVKR